VAERAGVAPGRYDFGVAAGDYDNDGGTDLFVTGFDGVTLWGNNRNGTFTNATSAAQVRVPGWSSSAAFVDFNQFGNLDLYVGRYLNWS
jgi:enediyne biosynthesis protein E4